MLTAIRLFRERVMNTSASEADLHLLKPSTKYIFRVAGFSSQGVSPNSAVVEAEMPAEGRNSD